MAHAPTIRALLCVALGASALQMPPVVICPGFGNADRDYVTPLDQPAEKGLVACLARRGFGDVTVLDLPRWEWARVAGGLVDPAVWIQR